MSTLTDSARVAAGAELHLDQTGSGGGGPRRRRSRLELLAPVIGVVVLFGGWEAYVRLGDVRRLTLPAPSSIVAHIAEEPGFYWRHGWLTFGEAAWGFLLALVAAFLVAVPMAHSRVVAQAAIPVIVLVQCTPVAALTPVFLIWFGFGPWPMLLVAALFAFVPFVSNLFTGLRSVDPATLEVLRSVQASRLEVLRRLRLPSSLPNLFAAARICVGLALVGATVGEWLGGATGGLGYQIRSAQARTLVDQLWGSVFCLALIGVVLTLLVGALERLALRWHSSQAL